MKLLNDLNIKGVKIVHTVHSLVAMKALCSLRNIPFSKLDLKDKFKAFLGNFLKINENTIMKV